jgi:hypothetical protein
MSLISFFNKGFTALGFNPNNLSVGPMGPPGPAGQFFVAQIKTADFAASRNVQYQVDTTANAVTATLPSSPTVGDIIQFEDAGHTWNLHNFTINRNGVKINSGTANYISSKNGTKLSAVYISPSIGWSIK